MVLDRIERKVYGKRRSRRPYYYYCERIRDVPSEQFFKSTVICQLNPANSDTRNEKELENLDCIQFRRFKKKLFLSCEQMRFQSRKSDKKSLPKRGNYLYFITNYILYNDFTFNTLYALIGIEKCIFIHIKSQCTKNYSAYRIAEDKIMLGKK